MTIAVLLGVLLWVSWSGAPETWAKSAGVTENAGEAAPPAPVTDRNGQTVPNP
jgi:hypothetical protein